jgi:thrombospondin type 3 repeat protein
MKANFKDPSVAGMSDAEFQAYLDARFPLGILPRPLDPFRVMDDGDYFDDLRSQANVTAIHLSATLDISSRWDVDGDGVLNACDNCPDLPNPGQGPVVFGESILAVDPSTFGWSTPSDVNFVRGDLAQVASYPVGSSGFLPGATSLPDAELPAIGSGYYYLVRPGGSCLAGSWQTRPGAEPNRDVLLP